nr:MAG TPA: hypothetical protein [Caudoviricetes sp.]
MPFGVNGGYKTGASIFLSLQKRRGEHPGHVPHRPPDFRGGTSPVPPPVPDQKFPHP